MPGGGGAEVAGAVQVDVTFLACLCWFEDPYRVGPDIPAVPPAVVAPDPVAIVLSRTLLTREFTWRSQLLQPVPADSRVLLARLRSARSGVSAGKG